MWFQDLSHMQLHYPCHLHLQASPLNCKGSMSKGKIKTQQGKGHIGQTAVSNLVIYDKTELILPINWKWKLKHHFLELLLNSLQKTFPFYTRPFFPIQWKWKSFQYHPIISNMRILLWAITHCRRFFMFLSEKKKINQGLQILIIDNWQC